MLYKILLHFIDYTWTPWYIFYHLDNGQIISLYETGVYVAETIRCFKITRQTVCNNIIHYSKNSSYYPKYSPRHPIKLSQNDCKSSVLELRRGCVENATQLAFEYFKSIHPKTIWHALRKEEFIVVWQMVPCLTTKHQKPSVKMGSSNDFIE